MTVRAMIHLALVGAATSAGCGASARPPSPARTPVPAAKAQATASATADCSTRSDGEFADPFTSAQNEVLGPVALVGARQPMRRQDVRELGGKKMPVLVRNSHRVTITLAGRQRGVGLAYGSAPAGADPSIRERHTTVTFTACRTREVSAATRFTFWSGFVRVSSPRCVPLRLWVDDEPKPRRTVLRIGVRACR